MTAQLQVAQQDKERLYQLNVDCAALIIRQSEERKKQRERAEQAESALKAAQQERNGFENELARIANGTACCEYGNYLQSKQQVAEARNKRLVELLKEVHEAGIEYSVTGKYDVVQLPCVVRNDISELLREADK